MQFNLLESIKLLRSYREFDRDLIKSADLF